MRIRHAAHALGLRFRLHRKDLPGKPDIVFPKYRTAVFVHGCFWHRHKDCPKASTPKSNISFWEQKFEQNVKRDEAAYLALHQLNWRTLVIWECQTKDRQFIERQLQDVLDLKK
jgi:DNA mismatch endonuclease (patch repair protein)